MPRAGAGAEREDETAHCARLSRAERGRGQPEHRDRRQGRRHQVPGAADVAAGRRPISRHRRCGDHLRPERRAASISAPTARWSRDRSEVGFYTSPGKDATLDRETLVGAGQAGAGRRGLWHRSAAVPGLLHQLSRRPMSEYEYCGGINGAPIEVFKSDVTGLLLPANAEIIIEGFSYPDKTSPRGHSASSPAITAGRRRDALHRHQDRALPQQSHRDLRADGRLARPTSAALMWRRCAKAAKSGPISTRWACPGSRASGRRPRPPAGA